MAFSSLYLNSRTTEELRIIRREGGMLTRAPATGDAIFDRLASDPRDHVGTGTVASAVQRSGYVRPASWTRSNGFDLAPGILQERDLAPFSDVLPADMRNAILELSRDRLVILYRFFNPASEDSGCDAKTHGYIVTDEFHRLLFARAESPASRPVIEAMTAVVSFSDHGGDPTPTGDYIRIAQGASVEMARRYVEAAGMFFASSSAEMREGPFPHAYRENQSFFACTGDVRLYGSDPADIIAMIAIRQEIDPGGLEEKLRPQIFRNLEDPVPEALSEPSL